MKPSPTSLNSSDAALLRRTVTQSLSDDEHELFLLACQRSGLDPFARQIYFMRKEGKFVIEATIDGMRLSAERSAKYSGQIGPEWCGPDGVWKDIWTSQQPPVAACVGILRSDFAEPVWGKCLYAELSQGGDFWERMPANQLAKCAEAAGFRKAFPQKFSGLYTPDEVPGNAAAVTSSGPQLVPEHGGSYISSPRPAVPLPLQGFVIDGTIGNRRNVEMCFTFIRGELEAALGPEGIRLFNSIRSRLPRIFKTRQECCKATIDCWVEMWGHLPETQKEAA